MKISLRTNGGEGVRLMHKMPMAAVMAVMMKRMCMREYFIHAQKVWIKRMIDNSKAGTLRNVNIIPFFKTGLNKYDEVLLSNGYCFLLPTVKYQKYH